MKSFPRNPSLNQANYTILGIKISIANRYANNHFHQLTPYVYCKEYFNHPWFGSYLHKNSGAHGLTFYHKEDENVNFRQTNLVIRSVSSVKSRRGEELERAICEALEALVNYQKENIRRALAIPRIYKVDDKTYIIRASSYYNKNPVYLGFLTGFIRYHLGKYYGKIIDSDRNMLEHSRFEEYMPLMFEAKKFFLDEVLNMHKSMTYGSFHENGPCYWLSLISYRKCDRLAKELKKYVA